MIQVLAQLTSETTFTVTIAVGGTIAAGLIGATWRAANFLRDVRDELKALRKDVRGAWTRIDHERWAHELERQNRELPLTVPAVKSRDIDTESPFAPN